MLLVYEPLDDEDADDEEWDQLLSSAAMPKKEDSDAYWAQFPSNAKILKAMMENPRRRGRAKSYSGDGVTAIRMSHTEVALRLARKLAESPLVDGTVYLQLGGAELRRRGDDPIFPVAAHLSRWGFSKDASRPEAKPRWIGFYSHKRHSRKLLLNFDRSDGHVMAFLANGQRLIVHCTAGNVTETRSPAEVHDLNRAIGRAVGWHGTRDNDIIAVCTPRSERFRKLTALKAKSVGVQRAGLKFFHVDRGGDIIGLRELSPEA